MLYFGKKNRALRDKIKFLTLVLSEKKILNETKKPYPPPCKLNGRSLNHMLLCYVFSLFCVIMSAKFSCSLLYLYINTSDIK